MTSWPVCTAKDMNHSFALSPHCLYYRPVTSLVAAWVMRLSAKAWQCYVQIIFT